MAGTTLVHIGTIGGRLCSSDGRHGLDGILVSATTGVGIADGIMDGETMAGEITAGGILHFMIHGVGITAFMVTTLGVGILIGIHLSTITTQDSTTTVLHGTTADGLMTAITMASFSGQEHRSL